MIRFIIFWIGGSLVSDRIKCIFFNNQSCQSRPTFAVINSKEPLYYPFSVSVDKCGGSYTIDDPYARICVPDEAKNRNVKVFNLILG